MFWLKKYSEINVTTSAETRKCSEIIYRKQMQPKKSKQKKAKHFAF